jgi:ABC-2 type transport system permease protein
MLFAPVMAMLIFGFAFGNSPKHIPIIIVNKDEGGTAAKLIDKLDKDALKITTSTDTEWAHQRVKEGKAVGVVVFGPTFTADSSPTMSFKQVDGKPVASATPPKGARAQVFLDTTNQQLSAVVMPALAQGTIKLASDLGAKSPISFDTDYAFAKAKNARYIDYFVPGIMAFAVMLFTTLLTLLAFVTERTSGTLNRLRVSPATEAEVVVGYELAFGLIAAVQGALVLTVAILVYHILVVGPLWVAALFIVLTAIAAQAIGILVSAAAQRESQAVQFIPFIIFPVFLLSGIFIPIANLPDWLRPFSYLLPPTWAIEGLRNVMLRGWGFQQVWPSLAVLAGFTVVFTLLAIAGLKRRNA